MGWSRPSGWLVCKALHIRCVWGWGVVISTQMSHGNRGAEPVAGMTTTQLCIDRGHKGRLSTGVGLARVLAKEMRVTIVISLG